MTPRTDEFYVPPRGCYASVCIPSTTISFSGTAQKALGELRIKTDRDGNLQTLPRHHRHDRAGTVTPLAPPASISVRLIFCNQLRADQTRISQCAPTARITSGGRALQFSEPSGLGVLNGIVA